MLIVSLVKCLVMLASCPAYLVEEVFEHFPNTRVMLKPFSDQELLTAVAALVSDRGSYVGA